MKVLIAEDEPVSRLLLQTCLEHWGYEVVSAQDGAEAWACFEQGAFSLVISDWMMPRLDGLELIRRIRSSARPGYVYTILLTARSQKEDLLTGMAAGADDFVTKPFDSDELRVRLRAGERVLRLESTLVAQNQELRDKNVQMETDLRMACEIQRALLPQHAPRFPHEVEPADSALRFYHRYLPTGTIGGDFFDIRALSDTEAGVFICDVMGHGVRAALITTMIRALLEELRPVARDPAHFLMEINRALAVILGETDVPMFVSAFYLVIDAASGVFHHANAGHPLPLLLRRDARLVSPLASSASGPPLGMNEHAIYAVAQESLAVHDLLVLFTDGLYELANARHEFYGLERLLDAVRRRLDLDSEQLFDELLEASRQFSAHKKFHDDVCLLGVEHAAPLLDVKDRCRLETPVRG